MDFRKLLLFIALLCLIIPLQAQSADIDLVNWKADLHLIEPTKAEMKGMIIVGLPGPVRGGHS